MSKNNMLLGYARGKVGSLVFNRLKGQQVTKAHNAAPANPKTYAQMAQRCRYNTAVARYKMAQRKFFKFAYEDKRPHESDFNAFMRHNMMAVPYATKQMIADNVIPPASLLVSSGSLASILYDGSDVTCEGLTLLNGSESFLIYSPADSVFPGIGDMLSVDDYVSDLSTVLQRFYPWLEEGDLLTACAYCCDDFELYDPFDLSDVVSFFSFAQFRLDFSLRKLLSSLGADSMFCYGTSEALLVNFGFGEEMNVGDPAIQSGIIVTRKSNGANVLISDCKLTPNYAYINWSSQYSVDTINTPAIASYSPSSPAILNPSK